MSENYGSGLHFRRNIRYFIDPSYRRTVQKHQRKIKAQRQRLRENQKYAKRMRSGWHWSNNRDALGIPSYTETRKAIATKRYESYGNRYLRSIGLTVRPASITAYFCGGTAPTCLANTQFGSAGSTKFLEYQFSGKSPVTVATNEDWISFDVTTETAEGAESGVKYIVQHELTYFQYVNSVTCATGLDGPFTRRAAALGPIGNHRIEYAFQSSSSCGDLQIARTYFDHFSTNIIPTGSAPCSFYTGSNAPISSSVKQTQMLLERGGVILNTGELAVTIIRCDAGSDPLVSRIRVSDPTGEIHVGSNDAGQTDSPTVVIYEGDTDEGYEVQSAEYSQVWYTVPADYSTCTCPDFTQQVSQPISEARSWVGSNAGGFNPCKHIMAVKRVLQVPQFYTDYVPYPQNTLTEPVVRYDDGEGNRLSGYR